MATKNSKIACSFEHLPAPVMDAANHAIIKAALQATTIFRIFGFTLGANNIPSIDDMTSYLEAICTSAYNNSHHPDGYCKVGRFKVEYREEEFIILLDIST